MRCVFCNGENVDAADMDMGVTQHNCLDCGTGWSLREQPQQAPDEVIDDGDSDLAG